ncbi:MAG: type II toxin-antitoxin system PrlF family antitoxin [Propionibacteriaceae bacterium]|nr:type II toxin-antitoxin system PrlF family antitoxin [Propionibacteriaceae bacterium]
MAVATVTGKGQVTIPVGVRRAAGIDAGAKVDFFNLPDGTVAMVPRRRGLDNLFGALADGGPVLGVEAMDEAVSAVVAADDERIRAGR